MTTIQPSLQLQPEHNMDATMRQAISKVPAVTLGFWVIKVIATTLGETGGDAVTMTWGLYRLSVAARNDVRPDAQSGPVSGAH